MRLTLKNKIVCLALGAAILPMLVMMVLTVRLERKLVSEIESELNELARENIAQIARGVYGLCKTANDLIQEKINYDLNVARDVLKTAGAVSLDATNPVEWRAVNQLNAGDTRNIHLPRMLVGGTWLGKTTDISKQVPIVDEVKRLVGGTCTVFQKMNENGDMLRVATNVEGDGERAIGTFIPCGSPVIQAVLRGETFRGEAYVVNARYITAYEPLRDASGKIVGMLYVGEKLESVDALRNTITDIKVGKGGYVYVIGGNGKHRGCYVIAKKNSGNDGKDVWDEKVRDGEYPIREIVETGVKLKGDKVDFVEYLWKNPGETDYRKKIAAIAYFEPWDWVIGAGMYEEDYHDARRKAVDAVKTLSLQLGLAAVIVLLVAVTVAMSLGRLMTKPLEFVISVAREIARGDVRAARKMLMDKSKHSDASGGRGDELEELLRGFGEMTDNLDSLIGEVQRSGIQVTSSSTQIAASARQLESAVGEQVATTREVNDASARIAGTSEGLVQTMDRVSDSASQTADTAADSHSALNRMEEAMRQLGDSTSAISSRLSVISDKANRISTVVTTIDRISDQTNLLALNAAIEAEKAGDYGKGFSVVARETSRLADQTAAATRDIERMVREMQSSVSSGVMEMDKFADDVRRGVGEVNSISEQLANVIEKVQSLSPMFDSVKEGMSTQSTGAGQISDSIKQLSMAAEQTRESLREFNQATEQLHGVVQGLKSEVSRFRISD